MRGRTASFGIGLMAIASPIVPVVDGIAKLLGDSFSPLLIAWVRYAIAMLITIGIASHYIAACLSSSKSLPP